MQVASHPATDPINSNMRYPKLEGPSPARGLVPNVPVGFKTNVCNSDITRPTTG